MYFAVTSFPLSLFSFVLTLCILLGGKCTDEWIRGSVRWEPVLHPVILCPTRCAREASPLAHRRASGKGGLAEEI